MRKFKVGDRVKLKIASNNNKLQPGAIGTVCHVRSNTSSIGIRYDKKHVGGHNCNHHCKDEHGWYSDKLRLTLLVESNDPTEGDINIMEIL